MSENNNYYKIGSFNLYCDICDRKRKREQVRKTYDGYMACISTCWYPKPPNEYPRKIVIDGYPVQNARPHPAMADLPSVDIPGYRTWGLDENLLWGDPTWTWGDELDPNDETNYLPR